MRFARKPANGELKDAAATLLTTAAITFATAPVVRRVMIRIGSLDVPNHRSSHVEPVPRGGGLACAAGIAGALTIHKQRSTSLRRVIPAVASLTAVGFLDDQLRGTPASVRLVAQALAGITVAEHIDLSLILSSIVMPAVVNVFNFMDGINGISGATAAVWGGNILLHQPSSAHPELILISALAAGSGLGFLPWNLPRARLFLGDVGSYLLGSLIACGLLITLRDPMTLRIVCAPLYPYMADASQAILLRASRRAPITEAHREHTYQKLVDQASLTHAGATAVHTVAAIGCATAWRKAKPARATALTLLITAGYLTSPYLISKKSK